MTQEDKNLLLQDLCARLSYGVKVAIEYSKDKYTKVYDLREIDNDATSELRQQVTVWDYGFYSSVISYPLIDCRPYLRPMSSMTEEEKVQLSQYACIGEDLNGEFIDEVQRKDCAAYIDWLNAHHFDYRGLIPKSLAIEVTDKNNPYKE